MAKHQYKKSNLLVLHQFIINNSVTRNSAFTT